MRPPRFNALVEIAAWLALLAFLGGFLGKAWWVFDCLSHFRLQYGAVFLLCAGIFTLTRRKTQATLCLIPGLAITAVFLTSLEPSKVRPLGTLRFKIVSFNVHTENTRHQDVLDFLQREDADLVFLMEINGAWLADLRGLDARYPYRLEASRADNFGIAVLSKQPLGDEGIVMYGDDLLPVVDLRLAIFGAPARFIGIHPLPPASAEASRLRNELLFHFTDAASAKVAPTILAGDFNLTPFSPWFGDLLQRSGLRDSTQGYGSFPTWMRFFPPFALPLDRALVSPELAVTELKIGPACGSDHNPLVITLAPGHAER